MTTPFVLPLALFVLTMSISPGPNNVMLTASGVNFGFRRTLPHMLGVSSGVMLMLLAVGLGLGTLFVRFPVLNTVLKYAGAAYLLYLAWRLACASEFDSASGNARPFTFLEAVLFQWVNPKAWVMVIGAIATYVPQQGFFGNLLVLLLVFAIVNLPSITVWVCAGTMLRNLLRTRRAIRIFNLSMAALLAVSLYPVFFNAAH